MFQTLWATGKPVSGTRKTAYTALQVCTLWRAHVIYAVNCTVITVMYHVLLSSRNNRQPVRVPSAVTPCRSVPAAAVSHLLYPVSVNIFTESV